MPFIIFLLWAFSFINFAYANNENDPFNNQQRKPYNTATLLQTKVNCKQLSTIAVNVPFEQIKIIGILYEKEQYKLLFIDHSQQIFTAVKQDIIGLEGLKIIDIQSQEIQLLDWRNTSNCDKPKRLSIQF